MPVPDLDGCVADSEPYLAPYIRASRQYGAGFGALLWASRKTQRARFDALRRACDLEGKSLLDAGCGRADLMGYLLDRDIHPADYIGLEAIEALAAAAEARNYPNVQIIRGDFIRDPARLFVGADIVVFSGSLNTLDAQTFYATLRRAYDAGTQSVIFNFLCSPTLAGKDYLLWHRPEAVLGFASQLAGNIRVLDDYLPGDCTVAMLKKGGAS